MVIKKQKLEKGNIMKFAHLSDTHLGYRQFGLNEREKDFYEVFELIIDKIIEENVDFVIHSGDLFETARPSPNALLTFQKGLLRLKGAGIPMFAIAGNHDSVMRKESIPPHVLFKKWGLKVISPINTNYMFDDVFIAGLLYYPSSQSKNLKNKLAALVVKNDLKAVKKIMDSTEVGGAPLLGVRKTVIKAHGSSDAKALKNAVRQAVRFTETGVIDKISASVEALTAKEKQNGNT